MKIIRDYDLAKNAINNATPCFYIHHKDNLFTKITNPSADEYIVGRRYQGLFDEDDGSFVKITQDQNGLMTIDRDCYGGIPLFYSLKHSLISTDLHLLADAQELEIDIVALSEYLSTAYLTGGKTIYKDVRVLMPIEYITVQDQILSIQPKDIFPTTISRDETEVATLLEKALDNSIHDLLKRFPKEILLNLSGGTDSTLLLAKIKEHDPKKSVTTTTFFHNDWRDDLNDWEYADQASKAYNSNHHLIKIHNSSFAAGHKELVANRKNVFHTYAAAFYLQNQLIISMQNDVPIINGSGPDESMIGTEKMSIEALQSLQNIEQKNWIDYLIQNIDYIKIPEENISKFITKPYQGFIKDRKEIAATLLDSPNFVEFQRRYHAITVLQDHIIEITAASTALARDVVFPYLTNDIFKIIFSSSFGVMNANNIYKSSMKKILEKYMPNEFVHRKKIGFQSPSRPYFKTKLGLGRELSKLLVNNSKLLNMQSVKIGIEERLNQPIDLHYRYDFLEWTTYNLLLLEKMREDQCLNVL